MLDIAVEKRQGRRCLCVSGIDNSDKKSKQRDFRDKMLQYNEVAGVLKYTTRELNGEETYEYVIGERDSLEDICAKRKADCMMIRTVLEGILETVIQAREYLLSEDDFLIRPNTVFLGEGYSVSLPYYPGGGSDLAGMMRNLGEFFLDKLDYGDEAAVMLAYGYYTKCKEQGLEAESLLEEIRKTRANTGHESLASCTGSESEGAPRGDKGSETMQGRPPSQKGSNRDEPRKEIHAADTDPYSIGDIYHNSRPMVRFGGQLIAGVAVFIPLMFLGLRFLEVEVLSFTLRVTIASVSIIFGILGEILYWRPLIKKLRTKEEESPTVMMPRFCEKEAFSLVSDEYPTIETVTFPFYIGRISAGNDYVLDYAGVSRRHIEISKGEEGYCITDLGSSNGTFVNSERLEPGVRTAVRRGDSIYIGPCLFYCN